MYVTEATRGHITVRVGDKSATVWGEMLSKSPGMPGYQLYGDSIKYWNTPDDNIPIAHEEKAAILKEVCEYLTHIGRTPVVLSD